MKKQNDIKGRNHFIYKDKGFTCKKCPFFIEMGDDIDGYKGCKILSKREYDYKDGDCPYSYNEYKIFVK